VPSEGHQRKIRGCISGCIRGFISGRESDLLGDEGGVPQSSESTESDLLGDELLMRKAIMDQWP
jgi:hypothetical protein